MIIPPGAPWPAVDEYYEDVFGAFDPVLEKVLKSARDAGLPNIAVSPLQGKFLKMLVEMSGAKRVLEIGTLAGYSAIWMARGLPEGGELVTLEIEESYAALARENIKAAGLKNVEVITGAALETMKNLPGAFDFIFIDADKLSNSMYLAQALKLSKAGTWIFADNVVRDGAILDPNSKNEGAVGIRHFNEMIAMEPRLEATAIQTVGAKGYDGFSLIRVKS